MKILFKHILLKQNLKRILYGIPILSFIFLLSCKNDMEKIKLISNFNNTPIESAKDITVIRSDSGNVQIYMTSSQLDRYEGEQLYTKFPKGLKVVFYDQNKQIKTLLTANYAINYEDRRVMEVQNNVVIVDVRKGDTIHTDKLTWDQNRRQIFSSSPVTKISQDGSTLHGDGFDSDDNFENYTLRNPRGSLFIDKDK